MQIDNDVKSRNLHLTIFLSMMNNDTLNSNRTITLLNVSITQVFPCITNMIVHPLNEHIVSLKSSEVKLMQDINQDKKRERLLSDKFLF